MSYKGLLCVLLLFTFTPAGASVIEKLSLNKLVDRADVIGLGRVVDVRTIIEDGEPWTVATVTVEKGLKGRTASTVKFRIPGGQQVIDGKTLVTRVEGSPEVNVNQKAVVFLNSKSESANDDYALTGLGLGYWRVEMREGREVASPNADNTAPALPMNKLIQDIERAVREKR